MIGTGEIHGLLPGERTLAAKLQIGRDTLRAALEILEAGGWISAREHGKRRQILKAPGAFNKKTATHRVAFLSPKPLQQLTPWMLIEFDTMRELLNRQGYELELTSPGLFHLRNPVRKLEKLIDDVKADAWVLLQCPAEIQRWFQEQQLPTLIRGYPQPGITIPCIDEDWHAAAFHAGGILKRRGHNRIGLLMPDAKLAGLEATERGLTQAIEGEPNPGSIYKMLDNGEPGSVARALEVAVGLSDPPTAMVATRSRHVLTIMSWLAKRRLRIPDDLSVIALCYETWYEHLQPAITHYHSEPDTMARSVVRKILQITAGRPAGNPVTLNIPECFQGQSVKQR